MNLYELTERLDRMAIAMRSIVQILVVKGLIKKETSEVLMGYLDKQKSHE